MDFKFQISVLPKRIVVYKNATYNIILKGQNFITINSETINVQSYFIVLYFIGKVDHTCKSVKMTRKLFL